MYISFSAVSLVLVLSQYFIEIRICDVSLCKRGSPVIFPDVLLSLCSKDNADRSP